MAWKGIFYVGYLGAARTQYLTSSNPSLHPDFSESCYQTVSTTDPSKSDNHGRSKKHNFNSLKAQCITANYSVDVGAIPFLHDVSGRVIIYSLLHTL